MTEKEFKSLSEKIWTGNNWACVIKTKDIKEFIKILKEELCGNLKDKNNAQGHIDEGKIDKLAGDKLI